jgi:formylglycine-generating enzyme required for sulfatase activity
LSREFVIVAPGGTKTLGADELPLQIGSSPAADLRLPGAVTEKAVALIGALDERPFLQAVDDAEPVSVNGTRLTATRWLEDGDVIAIKDARIACALDGDRWTFTINYADLDYATAPPVIAPESGGAAAEAEPPITPVRMRKPAVEAPRPTQRRNLRIALFGGLGVLLAVVLYLFTAKAVLIEVEPAGARIRIAGGLLAPKFGERFLLWPGKYRVLLSAEGYIPGREEITVGAAANQEFQFTLRKLPGRLIVTNLQNIPARVFVDDEEIGDTPTPEILLEPGPHTVALSAERYQPLETTVEVEGRDLLQTFEADLVPGWAEVSIASVPPGAAILSGDESLGETPATVELMAGSHELAVVKDGFKTWRQAITVAANEPQELPEIRLQEADGILTVISSPAGAAVSIDGRYRGNTPVEAELAPGSTYSVIVSKAGYETVTRKVAMEARRGRTIRVELAVRVGVIRITSQPPDADLFVDGKQRGKANQELTLPARAHRIEVRKAGFESYVAEVTPKPGLPQELEVILLTAAQAVLAATPQTITTGQGQTLRLVQPGRFKMGAPRREQGRRPNETQRSVELTRRFYIGLREITNTEFREFKPKHTSGAEKYRELAGGDHPAVMLGWEEAASFCNWLSERDSLPRAYLIEGSNIQLVSPPNEGYRLPTEAEWAWVARHNGGGGSRKYPWGERMPPTGKAGNYADRSAQGILANVISSYDDGFPVTAPVGRFPASPLGIFDLGGNAAEWVSDYYTVYPSPAGLQTDPVGPPEGQYHVIRGSSWRHASISELRFAFRDFGDRGRLDVGFRIARYADQPAE